MNSSLTYIDLFAGAGGLSEGFIREGYTPIAHVEMDQAACFTLRTRIAYHYLKANNKYNIYLSYLKGEISRSKLYEYIPGDLLNSVINLPIGDENNSKIHELISKQLQKRNVDLIIGGPPCQAYSLVGRARSEDNMQSDPRNFLYIQYAGYLEKYQPKMFVFENVIGIESAGGDGYYLKEMEKLFLEKGYRMQLFKVEANNFGVLQKRKRIIIIGWKTELNIEIPNLAAIKIHNKFTVNQVLSDLPKIKAGEGADKYSKYISDSNDYLEVSKIRNGIDIVTQHICRPHTEQDKEIYRIAVELMNNDNKRLDYNSLPDRLKTHNNRESFFDRFKVVAQNMPYSHTVVAHIAKDGHYYIHPDIEQNRSISIREAARLQSFPDDYYFEGVKENINRTPAYKQIGNAVPPLMASEIAYRIKNIIND